jgi:hypothetical protein
MASPPFFRVGASRDGGAIILDGVSVQYRQEPHRADPGDVLALATQMIAVTP